MLEVFLRGIGLFCQIYLRICAGAVIQESHKSPEGCQRILSSADAKSRNALVTFKEVFHTTVLLVPLRLMPCPNLWLHEKVWVLLSSSSTSYISWVSLTARTTTSVSTVREEYSAMPRFDSSSVWFNTHGYSHRRRWWWLTRLVFNTCSTSAIQSRPNVNSSYSK